MNTIRGAEIFSTGTHNGEKYTEKDLDDMVSAFSALDYRVPIKAGHNTTPGLPALGWLSNVRREGGKLIADFVDVIDEVYGQIKKKMYNTVSSEVYHNLQRGGKLYRRALKGVAILGADIPAVAGLKTLYDSLAIAGAEYHVYSFDVDAGADARSDVQFNPSRESESMMEEKQMAALLARIDQLETSGAASKEAEKQYAEKTATLEKSIADEKAAREAAEAKLKVALENKFKGDELARAFTQINDSEADRKTKEFALKAESERKLREAASAKLAEAEEEVRVFREQNAKLVAEQRELRRGEIAKTCRVPALRVFIDQFLDLATRGEEVHVFAEGGAKIPAIEAVTNMIKTVNANAAKLFTVVSKDDPDAIMNGKEGDIDKEVDRLVRKHQEAHKVSYHEAMTSVLNNDPDLKERYAVRYHA